MATFTLTVYKGHKVRTVIINEPNSNKLIGMQYDNQFNSLIIKFVDFQEIFLEFPSSTKRETFITSLIAGFSIGTTFSLNNL
ncbi:MAG: hypothetical protein WC123_04970 [Bacilli bacterium]|jgi:hypothetical protein